MGRILRVVGGSCRGRQLKGPKGNSIRPTQDRVKEAIFNVLMAEVEGSRFLDIFAGTGAIGIEALSRGAKNLTLIEKDRSALHLINENLKVTGFSAQIVSGDVFHALEYLKRDCEPFDIVFLDPPYGKGFTEPVLESLSDSELLVPGAVVVVETAKTETLPNKKGAIVMEKQKEYGDTKVSFFRVVDRAHTGGKTPV